jgi:uncharacterized protein (TIGR02145 family)
MIFYLLAMIGRNVPFFLFLDVVILLLLNSCKKDNEIIYSDPLTDIDGNVYNTITLGKQTWTAENLKVTRYNDGTPIPRVENGTSWDTLSVGAYCWYGNDVKHKDSYGALYNWNVLNNSHSVCPAGWHIPTDDEWTILINFLGGQADAGKKLKAQTSWAFAGAAQGNGTNESGFKALAGGCRYADGSFASIEYFGCWWSSTSDISNNAWGRYLSYYDTNVYRQSSEKKNGFSIRCIKD